VNPALRVLSTLPFLVPALASAFAADTPVYRCGNSYSVQRCGDAPALELADPRSAAERAQGADVAQRDQRLAETLAAQRRARDAPPPAARAARAAKTCDEAPAKVVRTGLVAPAPAAPTASCGRKPVKKKSAKRGAAASAPLVVHLPAR